VNGKVVPDYGKVQGILIGAVAAFVILITIIGPAEYVFSSSLAGLSPYSLRNHSSHFERHRVAFDERGAGDNAFIDDDEGALANSVHPDSEKASEERVSAEKPQIAAA
jgi:SHS family lactate transporter-like MFS transporter